MSTGAVPAAGLFVAAASYGFIPRATGQPCLTILESVKLATE